MAGYKTVSGSLHEDKGTWVVRGRVYDPDTGKIRQKSKSTGFKVKDSTKRKALLAMKDILAIWEEEANRTVPGHNFSLAYYINAWLKDKDNTVRPNTAKSLPRLRQPTYLARLGRLQRPGNNMEGLTGVLCRTAKVP